MVYTYRFIPQEGVKTRNTVSLDTVFISSGMIFKYSMILKGEYARGNNMFSV